MAVTFALLLLANPVADDPIGSLIVEEAESELRVERGLRRWALHDQLRGGFAHTPVQSDDGDTSIRFMREIHWLDILEQELLTRALRPRPPTAPIPSGIEYDIPLSDHELVDVYVDYFSGRGRKFFQKWLARAERYRPMFEPILEEHGIPRDIFYLSMIESGLSPKAYSVAAASGYWQFIRSTADIFGMRMDHWVDERRDFAIATHAACRYLKRLHRKFGDWHLAWASYNAGEGRIARAMKRTGAKTYWELVDKKAIPKETRHYVPKILAAAIVAKNAERYGFTDVKGHTPLTFDELQVKDALDLKRLAKALRVKLHDLRELNPSLLHDITPPRRKSILRVPDGLGEQAQAWIAKVPPLKLVDMAHYRIRRGDTLSRIAQRHGVSIASIKDFNSLRNIHTLRVGQKLVIPVSVKRKRTNSQSHRTVVASSKERKHVVANGETLWSISRRYGCSVDQLKRWNKMRSTSIRAGQVISIRR